MPVPGKVYAGSIPTIPAAGGIIFIKPSPVSSKLPAGGTGVPPPPPALFGHAVKSSAAANIVAVMSAHALKACALFLQVFECFMHLLLTFN